MLKPAFVAACQAAVADFARAVKDGPAVLLGTPWHQDGKLYNAAALLEGGQVAALRFKHDLPNYGVFDEKRVFAAGPAPGPIVFKGVRLGVMVCEDMWSLDASETLQESGAELLVVINGSPFEGNKHQQRLDLARDRVKETGLPLLYVNQVGGQDELVFDGASFALTADGDLRVQAPEWKNALMPTRWRREAKGWTVEKGVLTERGDRLSSIYQAMVLGLADYVRKNKFPGVVLGLSGGIDSALSAAVAADALGADRVHCVMMPSPYTSQELLEDAAACAALLECELREINIGPAMEAYRTMLAPSFDGPLARYHRGKYPVARPRRHFDGALQQIRLDGVVDRQQIRDVGRLCDALWRHVRRLFGAEGCLQDHRLRAVALAQSAAAARHARAELAA